MAAGGSDLATHMRNTGFIQVQNPNIYEKRRRRSTGGTADVMGPPVGSSYAQAAHTRYQSNLSVDEKLDLIMNETAAVRELTLQLQRQQNDFLKLYEAVENLEIHTAQLEQKQSTQNLRIINAEAQAKRDNLIFLNIPEREQESANDCEQALYDFMAGALQLSDAQLDDVVFQEVYRLGRVKRGVAPDGRPWKPRPLLARFRDFRIRQSILGRAKALKGTEYAIREDFPAEIRTARGKLWEDLKRAKSEHLKAKIAYPAKIVVEGQVVRDMFPDWGKWTPADVHRERGAQNSGSRLPKAGTPMDIPLSELIKDAPAQPRWHRGNQGNNAGTSLANGQPPVFPQPASLPSIPPPPPPNLLTSAPQVANVRPPPLPPPPLPLPPNIPMSASQLDPAAPAYCPLTSMPPNAALISPVLQPTPAIFFPTSNMSTNRNDNTPVCGQLVQIPEVGESYVDTNRPSCDVTPGYQTAAMSGNDVTVMPVGDTAASTKRSQQTLVEDAWANPEAAPRCNQTRTSNVNQSGTSLPQRPARRRDSRRHDRDRTRPENANDIADDTVANGNESLSDAISSALNATLE